jgi:hypothetical protein
MKTAIVLAALISAVSAVHITCTFQIWNHLKDHGDMYLCYVSDTKSTERKSIEAVTGTHLEGKSDNDVNAVIFSKCNSMDFIPKNIHEFFPNIIALGLSEFCKIETLNGDELRNYVNLEWFGMMINPLKRIPGNFFEFNPKIRTIDFTANRIAHVGPNLLNHLDNLTTAKFLANVCISKSASESRTEVLELIEDLKKNCTDPEGFIAAATDPTIN